MKEAFLLYSSVSHPQACDVPVDGTRTVIGDVEIPPGCVLSATPFALHSNPQIFGEGGAAVVRPEGWLSEGDAQGKEKYLLHFEQGHRKCIAMNMASIIMWKATVAILQRFDIMYVGVDGKVKPFVKFKMVVKGFGEVAGPLRVKVKGKVVV